MRSHNALSDRKPTSHQSLQDRRWNSWRSLPDSWLGLSDVMGLQDEPFDHYIIVGDTLQLDVTVQTMNLKEGENESNYFFR